MSVSSTKRRWGITIVSPFSLLMKKPFKYPPETALTPYTVSFKCFSPNNIRLTYSSLIYWIFLIVAILLDFDAPLVHSMCSWRSFSSSFSQFNLYLSKKIPEELPDPLPPMPDTQHAIGFILGVAFPNFPHYRMRH